MLRVLLMILMMLRSVSLFIVISRKSQVSAKISHSCGVGDLPGAVYFFGGKVQVKVRCVTCLFSCLFCVGGTEVR